MALHSTIVGGSTAGRLLNCPASYQATLALPASANRSSEFAEEGTAMHQVMTHLMEKRALAEKRDEVLDTRAEARTLVGYEFYDRKLTQAHLDEMILPALDALDELEAKYGGEFYVAAIEQSVAFPGIPGAHGTCDLILSGGTTMLHVDWKFGQGVGVKASYRDDSGETVNPQLMFYTASAMNTLKRSYVGIRTIAVAIIQPRSETPLSDVAISRKEVKWFVEDLQQAVVAATERDPPRTKGEHCRFAPCKINCPRWTGPLLELAALKPMQPQNHAPHIDHATPYGDYLAKAKALVDMLAMFKKEVDEQLHAYLEEGGIVPGWRLKAKAKQRQWIDGDTVAKALKKIGFKSGEIWNEKLVTFQSADATAKRLNVIIPDHLRVAPSTNETTVCRTDDPAPVLDRAHATAAVREALLQLK